MEFILRCNDLRCRNPLQDRAVVTTCSHVFCTQCADTTGLSKSTGGPRTCPACSASLQNPDDVVIAGLNPSEDYKTSVLSGLSPTIIMECASRAIAFHAYQTSQEIIYQEHLAKGLAEKYNTLSQQMDQLIHEANSQIKLLQEKLQTMHAEQLTLEAKNHELAGAFKEKSRAQQQIQKLYQSLKAQVMASHVANAAGDEAEMTLHSARGDRLIDRLPGTRTGSASYAQTGGGRSHQRADSRSSSSNGQRRDHNGRLGPSYPAQLSGHGPTGRSGIGPQCGTPSQARQSRLPVLGGTRQNAFANPQVNSLYQASPIARQNAGAGAARSLGGFALGGAAKMFRN